MAGPHGTHSLVRPTLALAAGAVTLSWLWALSLFPEGWRDHYGYNQLGALILTSGLHWAVCLPLAVAWLAGALGPWLPRLTFAAPLAHVAGSSINAPGCLPFFVAPSVAILIVGFLEAHGAVAPGLHPSATDPGVAPDAEPRIRFW